MSFGFLCAYLAWSMLIRDRFVQLALCFLHVVWRLVDIVLNPVHHLPLRWTKTSQSNAIRSLNQLHRLHWRCVTWASTSMARYWNMSCSSLMLLSSFRISSCRDSISFRACLVALVSLRIWTPYLLGKSWTAEPGTTFQGVIYEQQHKTCRILRTSYLS